jgi:hypothetical protein
MVKVLICSADGFKLLSGMSTHLRGPIQPHTAILPILAGELTRWSLSG